MSRKKTTVSLLANYAPREREGDEGEVTARRYIAEMKTADFRVLFVETATGIVVSDIGRIDSGVKESAMSAKIFERRRRPT